MAYTSAWLLKRASNAKSMLDNAIVFYVLVMMASMLASAVWYFLEPTTIGIIEALGLNMFVMSAGVIAVLRYWAGESDEAEESEVGMDPNELELERSVKISSGYVVYILVMMASMTVTEIFYTINTALTGLEEGLIAGTVIMTAGVIFILWYSSRHSTKIKSSVVENSQSTRSKFVRSTLISLIMVNEFMMGWLFTLVSGTPKIYGATLPQITESTFTSVAGSDWFLFTMALEIILSIYMLRNAFSRNFVRIVCLQSLAILFVPTAINAPLWVELSTCPDSVILVGLVLAYKNSLNDQPVRKYSLVLLVLYSLMLVGFLLWAVQGNALLLLLSIIGEMVLYFNTIIERISVGLDRSDSQKLTESPGAEDQSTLPLI